MVISSSGEAEIKKVVARFFHDATDRNGNSNEEKTAMENP